MPAGSHWKGYLKLSLVTCPVAMLPAISENQKLRFHTFNRVTGNRVEARYVDATTGKPVGDDDLVKGYPRGDDDYVMLEDAELSAVALDSSRTIDIEMFVEKSAIDWIWYDTPHFLVPGDKIGAEAFNVIREAMRETGMVGISKLVLGNRERAVMLDPADRGIVLWSLRYGDEIRAAGDYPIAGSAKPDRGLERMLASLIDERTQSWSSEMTGDPVQERLQEIVAAKRKGGRKRSKAAASPPKRDDNVIDLAAALRQSLAGKRRR